MCMQREKKFIVGDSINLVLFERENGKGGISEIGNKQFNIAHTYCMRLTNTQAYQELFVRENFFAANKCFYLFL